LGFIRIKKGKAVYGKFETAKLRKKSDKLTVYCLLCGVLGIKAEKSANDLNSIRQIKPFKTIWKY